MDQEMRTARVSIRGRVQGVGYRVWTERVAKEHGLKGWVRNRNDDTVEAVFQGEAGVVADMIRRCEAGPSGARVKAVEVISDRPDAGDETFAGFEVRATA